MNHGVFPDVTGGMERHTYNLCNYLQSAGVAVELLVPVPVTSTTFPFPVHHLPWPGRPLWLWSNYLFSRSAGDWVERYKPDIAFAQGFNLWAYLRNRSLPVVFHPHGLEMFGAELRTIEICRAAPLREIVRFHGRHADAVISLGGRLTEILVKKARVDRRKIHEIPNAVDTKAFVPGRTTRTKNSLLFVGRLAFNKGIDLLIDALRILSGYDFTLTIAGVGPLHATVERLASSDRRVKFVSNVTDEALHGLYQQHETLLFTSRFEGMPTVVLEAMASGCSVIATRIGAVDSVVDESCAVTVEPTATAVAEGIRAWLKEEPQARKNKMRSARTKVEIQFSWEKVVPRYLELFDDLARLKRVGIPPHP